MIFLYCSIIYLTFLWILKWIWSYWNCSNSLSFACNHSFFAFKHSSFALRIFNLISVFIFLCFHVYSFIFTYFLLSVIHSLLFSTLSGFRNFSPALNMFDCIWLNFLYILAFYYHCFLISSVIIASFFRESFYLFISSWFLVVFFICFLQF